MKPTTEETAATPTESTPLTKDDASGAAAPAQPQKKQQQQTSSFQTWAVVIATSVVMGILFGLTFYKSHVYEPQIIRGQFLFRRYVMLKVFFGAMGVGSLLFSVLSAFNSAAFEHVRQLWSGVSTSRGWITGPALGGCMLGMGMAICGACPGMVWTALGAGTSDSAVTIAGGILGALVYGLASAWIDANVLGKGPRGPTSEVYADGATGVSCAKLTAILGIVCLAGCVALEYLVPWTDEVPARLADAMAEPMCDFGTSTFDLIRCPAWPPSVAGMLLGTLQLPGVLLIGNVLGSSTAFQVCSAVWMLPLPAAFRNKLPYLNAFATPNPKAWWQIVYVALASLAAYLLSRDVDDFGRAAGVGFYPAFVGGFLMIFGSRLGGGCTSGHGLSGCAMLMVQSWIAVPAMFAGGIALAVAWQLLSDGGFFVPGLV